MRFCTIDDLQLKNCVKVLEGMPKVEPNANSPDGPIIVFDRGYGKKKMVDVVQSKNFKLITISTTVGSEHPIAKSSAIETYRERLLKNASLPKDILASLSEFDTKIKPWVMSDDPNILMGPELKICTHTLDSNLCALAIRDVFDKKIPQRVKRFFSYGIKETAFPNANEWLGVLKTCEKDQFGTPFNKREFSDLDNLLRHYCIALITYQWTADWFTLRAFHATARLAGSLLAAVDGANTNTADYDSILLTRFVNEWFSRTGFCAQDLLSPWLLDPKMKKLF